MFTDCGWEGPGVKYRPLSGHLGTEVGGSPLGTLDPQDYWQTVAWGSWSCLWGSFRFSEGADGSACCRVPVPTRLSVDCSWDVLEPSYRVLSESTVWPDQVWWANLQGLPACAEMGWSRFMGHFGMQSWGWGLYAYHLIHRWAWLFPGPLAYGASDRTKANGAVAEFSGYGAVSRSVVGTMVSESMTWVWAWLQKMTLLGLELHWSFTVFWFLKLPCRHFCSWMDAKLLWLRGGQE